MMTIKRITDEGFVVTNNPRRVYSPADDLPTALKIGEETINVQALVDEHEHKDRRSPAAKQAYLDRIEAERIASIPTPEEKERQAQAEARKIIQERLIERELETDTDMKALIEEAKTKDNPGHWLRDNLP